MTQSKSDCESFYLRFLVRWIFRGGGDNVGSVEQIVPQERLKTSNVSYVYVVCGNEWRRWKYVYNSKTWSFFYLPDDKRSFLFLRFLRYVDIFPRIFWINIGMSDWCFFFTTSTKTVL